MKAKSLLPVLGCAAVLGYLLRPRRRISFRNKVVVITGGSRGLGLALAREFAVRGARIHLLARDEEELGRAARSLPREKMSVTTWVCDLCAPDQIEATITAIVQKAGTIDLLVNNAGIILVAPFEKLRHADFAEAMQMHFWAPLRATTAALPALCVSRGGIVNIASIGGRIAVPHLAAYSASKFALVGLSESLHVELRQHGIRVTTVSPGLMRTGSHIHAKFKGDHSREFTWFSLGATLPLVSIGAERAARQIIAAIEKGRAELTITLQARAATIAHALAPAFVARVLALANRILPRARQTRQTNETLAGLYCSSALSPSILTALGDQAGQRLNERS